METSNHHNVSTTDLLATIAARKESIALLQSEISSIYKEIYDRHSDEAMQAFDDSDKSAGVVRFATHEGIPAKVEVKKSVKWDSDILRTIMNDLPAEKINRLFDIKISMKEKVYDGLLAAESDESLIAAVENARTVRFSVPLITLGE